jgi:hypothetical protein
MSESSIRRPPDGRPTAAGEAVDVDWDRIADGLPRRLQRGTDFSEPVNEFVEAARATAARTGRSVVVVRDRLAPDRFVWLQFADAEIAIGDPCPCGGRRLTRMTAVLLRCDTCGRTLTVGARPPKPRARSPKARRGDLAEGRPASTLADFSEIRLVRTDENARFVEYAGLGVDDTGTNVVLVVRVPLVGGQPVPDPRSPTGQAHEVVAAVPESVWGAVSDQSEDQAWDIVVA